MAGTTRERLQAHAPAGWRVHPGFVDLQVNGAGGFEIGADRTANGAVARALARGGVTGFLPTLVSRPLAEYARCAEALAATPWPADGARNLGVHLEGPFLAPRYAGAHAPAALLNPTRANVEAIIGAVAPRAVTLAPELPGALDAIARLSADGILVFVGHTGADAATARAAIDAGAVMLVHAFNAMRGLEARAPSALTAFLSHPHAWVSVIADGVHVHPETLALLRPLVERRLVLVSDAAAPAGASPGEYRLGPRQVRYDGSRVTADGRLAGSGSLLEAGPRTLVASGWTIEDALRAASLTPRDTLGLPPAKDDLVLLDEDLRVRMTAIGGRVVHRADDPPEAQPSGTGSP